MPTGLMGYGCRIEEAVGRGEGRGQVRCRCVFGAFCTLGVTGDPVVGKPGHMTKLPERGVEILLKRDSKPLAV